MNAKSQKNGGNCRKTNIPNNRNSKNRNIKYKKIENNIDK